MEPERPARACPAPDRSPWGARRQSVEVDIPRNQVTSRELREWIVAEVRRRHPEWSGFDADLTLRRLESPQRLGLTWSVDCVPQLPGWSADVIAAFSDVVWEAQRRFDVKD